MSVLRSAFPEPGKPERLQGVDGLAGQTAGNIGRPRSCDALPPYLAVVVGLSLVLLMPVFRSVVVPLPTTGGFLLPLAAAFGAVAAMYLLGEKSWSLPRWLDRILADVDVEGARLAQPRRRPPNWSTRLEPWSA